MVIEVRADEMYKYGGIYLFHSRKLLFGDCIISDIGPDFIFKFRID